MEPLTEWTDDDDDVSLSEELEAKAEEKLGENPQTRSACLAKFRQLIKSEKNLYSRTDTSFLLRYLRRNKFNVDAAFHMLLNCYKLRKSYPHLFENLCPECLRYAFEHELQVVLKERDTEGRIVGIIKPGAWNINLFSLNEVLRIGLVLAEHVLKDERNQINGVVVVADVAGLGFHHLRVLTIEFIRLALHIVQDCWPVSIEAVHVINEPQIFDYIFALVKPFMRAELLSRIHLHGSDLDSLYQYVPADILTEEYGGKQMWSEKSDFFTTMYEDNDLFLEDLKYGYNDDET